MFATFLVSIFIRFMAHTKLNIFPPFPGRERGYWVTILQRCSKATLSRFKCNITEDIIFHSKSPGRETKRSTPMAGNIKGCRGGGGGRPGV